MSLQDRVKDAFISSCRDEIMALKPGNVHVFAPGHGMTVDHFLTSAAAAALPLTQPGLRVGQRIRGAVEASFSAAGLNTNLGILLLCAPLAAAAQLGTQDLNRALNEILNSLDQSDAAETFEAITRASPGGLGTATQHDVHQPPMVTLSEAMAEAAPRDRIAWQFVSNFEDIFTTGLNALAKARRQNTVPPWTTVSIYLAFLSKFPDTHIMRKFGFETAEKVRIEAISTLTSFEAKARREESFDDLMALDTKLKAQGLNPGTSADLTVATLFADRLSGILLQPRING
jgi:triphosphoribosyl-dephospho-CoA synthase